MAKPVAVNREIAFNIAELFFSRTDARGVILSGNDVFVRVSGYPREKLCGSPHSLVRHPDMPKAVFKVLWSTIQAGKPISAYVKNLAADGSYYWVFATVFPVGDGYLSIRLKPSTALFAKIPQLYQRVLEKERKEGMDAGLVLLNELLATEGFRDYGKFVTEAIVAETFSRSKELEKSQKAETGLARKGSASGIEGQLLLILQRCGEIVQQNAAIFGNLDRFLAVNKAVREKSGYILKSLQSMDLLAVNMSTAARRLGSQGLTLVAVANAIQKAAQEFKSDLKGFNEKATHVEQAIQSSEFQIATSRLQLQMIEFYMAEAFDKIHQGISAEEIQDMKENSKFLLWLCSTSMTQIGGEMQKLRQLVQQLALAVEQLRGTINTLEIIRKTGGIEAAQVTGAGTEFETYFKGMNDLVLNTGQQLVTFNEFLRGALQAIDEILPAASKSTEMLREVEAGNAALHS